MKVKKLIVIMMFCVALFLVPLFYLTGTLLWGVVGYMAMFLGHAFLLVDAIGKLKKRSNKRGSSKTA